MRLPGARQKIFRLVRYRLCALLSAAMILFSLAGCDPTTRCPPPRTQKQAYNKQQLPPGAQKIQHVVVIFQENRTPDNLFHDPVLITRGADIATSGLNSAGQTVPLTPMDLANNYDLDHSHRAFLDMCDCGKMDRADKVGVFCPHNAPACPPSNPQFKYVNPSEVQPYFQLAEQFTFADRMFQTNQGPSFPAHQFIISGTSAPAATSRLFAAENPTKNAGGCLSPPGMAVLLIDPSGEESSVSLF